MEPSWNWHDDGSVTLKGAGKPRRYRPRKIVAETVVDLMEQLSRLLEINVMLSSARNAFMSGRGDYSEAFDAASNLVDGVDRSQAEARAVLAQVSSFYEPEGVAAAFAGAPEALAKFCDEALKRLSE